MEPPDVLAAPFPWADPLENNMWQLDRFPHFGEIDMEFQCRVQTSFLLLHSPILQHAYTATDASKEFVNPFLGAFSKLEYEQLSPQHQKQYSLIFKGKRIQRQLIPTLWQ